MRLTATFVFTLTACLFTAVTAIRHPRLGSLAKRGGHNISPLPQSIAARQFHPRRDLLDLCISVDVGALANILHLIDPLAAKLHLCLCLQDLNLFLDTDLGILLGNLLGGKDNLTAYLKLLINTSPHTEQCAFPPHAHHACVIGKPCAFTCDVPYVQVGKTCVCPPPMTECNGRCGSFPNGCGSVVPHHPRKRTIGPVTTLAEAKSFCKPNESVCGISGREEKAEFECVDTAITLDSCGGCITPHPFPATQHSAVKGKECGRLPGVVTAVCSNSQCSVSQCLDGWEINSNRTECIFSQFALNPGTALRMRKERRRRDASSPNTDLVIDPILQAKLRVLVGLVVDLNTASTSAPPLPSAPGAPHQLNLINAIVAVTFKILSSSSVASLIENINGLVYVDYLVSQAIGECSGCIDELGAYLDKVIRAALDIQQWCGHHPVAIPGPIPHPTGSPASPAPTPHPIPNTSHLPISVGLDDLLSVLGLGSIKADVYVSGLGSGLSNTVNNLLDGLGIGPGNVRPRRLGSVAASADVVVDSELLDQIKLLVNLVHIIKDVSPQLPAPSNSPPIIGPYPTAHGPSSYPSVDTNLIDAIVHATIKILNSPTVAALVGNVDVLVDVNSLVLNVLGGCGCVDTLGLGPLVKYLEELTKIVLGIQEWCSQHPVGGSPHQPSGSAPSHPHPTDPPSPGSPSGPAPAPMPNDSNDAVIVGLDDLLHDLGLGSIKADVVVKGLVGVGLANTINNILNNLGVGPANVRPRRSDPLDTLAIADVSVDADLLDQIKAFVNLVIILRDTAASSLPVNPQNSPPIIGDFPGPAPAPVNQNLIDAIVRATVQLLQSATVNSLLGNLNALVDVTALVSSTLATCGCVDDFGLTGLVRDLENVVEAVLGVKSWCEDHPVVVAPGSGPSATVPAPGSPGPASSPSTISVYIPLNLGLDDLLATLGLDVQGNVDLQGLVDGLVGLIADLQLHSSSLPPAPSPPGPPSPAPHVPSSPGSPPPPVDKGLIDEVLKVVANLLQSLTSAQLLANVNALINVNSLLGQALGGCDCVDSLGLAPLVKDVENILYALLDIKDLCNGDGAGGAPGLPSSPPPTPTSGGSNNPSGPAKPPHGIPIIVNAEELLDSLGLGDLLQVDGIVDGLGDGINNPVNSILGSLGLGGVRRWFGGRG